MDKIYTVDELKTLIIPIAKKYGINKVILFGSYADGTARATSDVDLIIDKGNLEGLIQFNSFIHDLENLLHKKIDVITTNSLKASDLSDNIKTQISLYHHSLSFQA